MKRILITGSRDWPESEKGVIEYAIAQFVMRLPAEEEVIVVHGAAEGVDTFAGDIAKSMTLKVEPHPITKEDWNRDGKKAGFVRNSKMVDLGADICFAFIKDQSRGATMCADLAEKNDIATIRWRLTNGQLT